MTTLIIILLTLIPPPAPRLEYVHAPYKPAYRVFPMREDVLRGKRVLLLPVEDKRFVGDLGPLMKYTIARTGEQQLLLEDATGRRRVVADHLTQVFLEEMKALGAEVVEFTGPADTKQKFDYILDPQLLNMTLSVARHDGLYRVSRSLTLACAIVDGRTGRMIWQGRDTVSAPVKAKFKRVRGFARSMLVDMAQEAVLRILKRIDTPAPVKAGGPAKP